MNFRKVIRLATVAVVSMLVVVGCSKRRILSDDELAQIFHDAYLANAYSSEHFLQLDTLKLYEPIFQRYGYTTEDVQFTIGSFSTRKSARLSDVVERSIQMLEQEGKVLDREVAVLDTLNNYAVRHTTSLVYQDSLIKVRKFTDTVDLRVTLERPAVGNYHIEFDYFIDSLDTTPMGYRSLRWAEEYEVNKHPKKGEDSLRLAVKRYNSSILSRARVSKYKSTITVDDRTERLEFVLGRAMKIKGKPHITIKNLEIKRVLDDDIAQDSLYRELLPVIIFDDELLFKR